MRLFLLNDGLDVVTTQDEKYAMVIAASTGELNFDGIKNWLMANVK